MVRMVGVLVALLLPSLAFAQPALRTVRTWHVAWRSVLASDGSASRVPVLSWAEPEAPATGERYTAPPEIVTVVLLDDRLRTAARAHDTAEIDRILSAQFSETDVNGAERDKRATLQLVERGDAAESTLDMMTARAAANAVVLTGEETDGTQARRRFTRVYVRDSGGDWKLLSSATVPAGR